MARPPKGKPLTLRPIRLDDDVWAECQRLGKEYGTINEGLRACLFGHTKTVKVVGGVAGTNYDIGPLSFGDNGTVDLDNRPKNAYCKHCGSRFAGARFATICSECKSDGHTNQPAECPRCTEGSAI